MKMLVTGATGKLGSKVVETLLKFVPASQVAVSVRNPEKAEGLRAQGVEVRHGDFDRPETLTSAFAGPFTKLTMRHITHIQHPRKTACQLNRLTCRLCTL